MALIDSLIVLFHIPKSHGAHSYGLEWFRVKIKKRIVGPGAPKAIKLWFKLKL